MQNKFPNPKERGSYMKNISNCDTCANYVYDEDYEYYVCMVNLDEDEMVQFMTNSRWECPYYQCDDEYKVVRHQM